MPPDAAIAARLRAAGCVFAEDEAELLASAARSSAALERMVRRRIEGEPIEVIVGWAQFCGLRIAVGRGVFVPRVRTELLARRAAGLARRGDVVVDLCCGSGAIGAVVTAHADRIRLFASDSDPAAIAYARRNLPGATIAEGDLFDPLPDEIRGAVAVLVANVPYVPSGEIALLPGEASEHEPRQTLDGGPDGLDVLRRVSADALDWLAPDGHTLVETTEAQAQAAAAIYAADGLTPEIEIDAELEVAVIVASAART